MSRLFHLSGGEVRHPEVERWFRAHDDALGAIALRWFDVARACGEDVRELLHDGQPTACVGEAAFCYVDAHAAHVGVGFFPGADLAEQADPRFLLEGRGKFMRHVKLRPDREVDEDALTALVHGAYRIVREDLAEHRE